jgi:hypothetical protein
MPLQVGEDLLGVIKIPLHAGDTLRDENTSSVTRYLAAVAQVLSNIYQLTRSRDLAMRDDLTKAYNRRSSRRTSMRRSSARAVTERSSASSFSTSTT